MVSADLISAKPPIIAWRKGENAILTPNFRSSEFDCPCSNKMCTYTLISMGLVRKLQRVRVQVGPIHANSGFRCGPHNKEVGGEDHSFHLFGMAADIRALDAPIEALIKAAEYVFACGGIGKYVGRIHVDDRPYTARWTKIGKE